MSQNQLEKIYNKFADLKKEAEQNCKIDRCNLDNSFNNTELLIKWINKKSDWNSVLRNYEMKRKDTYRKLYEEYQTDYPLKLNTKDEYNLFIESDSNYVEIFTITQVLKEITLFIDSTIDVLRGRGFEIKNYIDWCKFKNGL